jgi:hypothetical protein
VAALLAVVLAAVLVVTRAFLVISNRQSRLCMQSLKKLQLSNGAG